ncbi:hypothetical protein [Spirosoma spitsbergense]|jgi:hypothetical protein|uniref:hypothetical protein n=1 Tax=Spirosoma spitsbergense TaxID=431554 RepID=UPI000377FD74|nr:hypothetical protein [Spirosoma spitsbergense]
MIAHKLSGPTVILVVALFLQLPGTSLYAQRKPDETSYYRTVPVPAHLLPIERAYGSSSLGSVYFYGGKKLSSPYSLEIPFFELNDPEVTHHFKAFRTLVTVGRLTALVPLAYILFQNNNRYNGGAYWTVYGGSLVTSLTLTIIGNGQVNKAVTRYNDMLSQPRIGLSASPIPMTGQIAVGAGVSLGF